jgi:hypothetical protein
MGTEKQEKQAVNITFLQSHLGTLNIVFLDVWLSHKARHQLAQAQSGLRLLPQFLGAFSQGQMLTHMGKVPLQALTLHKY